MRLVFDSSTVAVHHFQTIYNLSGDLPCHAVFHVKEKMTLTIVPFFGGPGISFENLGYDAAAFEEFCKQSENAPELHVYLSYVHNGEICSVELPQAKCITLKGFEIS